jgi:hypothetical protein
LSRVQNQPSFGGGYVLSFALEKGFLKASGHVPDYRLFQVIF